MNAANIKKIAAEIDSTLRVDDEGNFDSTIFVVHQDGSLLLFKHAHVQYINNWYCIFSEHNGWYVIHEADTVLITQDNEIIINQVIERKADDF